MTDSQKSKKKTQLLSSLQPIHQEFHAVITIIYFTHHSFDIQDGLTSSNENT